MAPSLNPRYHEAGACDWVLFRPVVAHEGVGAGEVQRGDVVTFWKPHQPEEVGIKRVVGLEGDTVWPKRGYALEKQEGARLAGMPDGLGDEGDGSIVEKELGKVVVPYGHVWVEGDNWRSSLDSNDFGPISKSLVQEKAVWVWRGWGSVMRIGDERDGGGSRVVEGKSEIPELYLE